MATREEIMDKLIEASLSSSPKATLEFEIDGTTREIDALDELIVKILRTHWSIVNKVDTKLRKMLEISKFKIIGRKKIIA